MPTNVDTDYWQETSQARPQNAAHPLAVFNPGECGAWIATLRALRALPDSGAYRRPSSARLHDAETD